METVGVYLKKEREAKNFSLREVSRLTKISEFYLEYIEKDDFAKLPQGPYIKGYISTYSRSIGGDVAEALKLYDSLNKKKNHTEDIQAETPAGIRRPNPPEEPKANLWKQSYASLVGKTRSSFNAVASSLKAKSASLKTAIPPLKTIFRPFKKISSSPKPSRSLQAAPASTRQLTGTGLKKAGASIKTIAPSIQKKCAAVKTMLPIFKNTASAVTTNSWIAHRRIGLYAGIALLGVGVLVLLGWGYYNLFIDDARPPIVADSQMSPGKGTSPLSAMDAEKKALPPKSQNASEPPTQLEESAGQKEPVPLLSPSADQKRPSSLSTHLDPKESRATSKGERSSSTSKPDNPISAPPSRAPLPAENTASSQTNAGKPSTVPTAQSGMALSPSPGPTTTAANLSVLSASICSEIKNRMPAGVDTSFPSSVQRVYVWSQVEARRVPSTIRHIYYFKDRKISDVALNIRSSNWRTWSYKTISSNRARGEWRVDIASADGKVLRSLYFEIK